MDADTNTPADTTVQTSPSVVKKIGLTETALGTLKTELKLESTPDKFSGNNAILVDWPTSKKSLQPLPPKKKPKQQGVPLVMKPFESFVATELTVQSLRRLLEVSAEKA